MVPLIIRIPDSLASRIMKKFALDIFIDIKLLHKGKQKINLIILCSLHVHYRRTCKSVDKSNEALFKLKRKLVNINVALVL